MANKPAPPAGKTVTLPAPVQGWNARDSVAAMRQDEAIVFDDLFPDATEVKLRPGALNHVTGAAAAVESLMTYTGGTSQQMFAAAGTAFYDVTAAGAIGAAVVSGLSNSRWESINFATSSANWLITANGVDNPRYWDGATWVSVNGVSVPAITGVTTSTLAEPVGHENRMWFIQVNTLIAWYLPVDAVGGAATAFPLRSYATRGGHLVTVKNLAYDTNNGPQNFLVFFTSEGEAIVFQGTDPSSPTTWSLTGVYYIGQLVSNRCIAKIDGDLLVLTKDGLYAFSTVIRKEVPAKSNAWSDRIRKALTKAIQENSSRFGWEVQAFPDASILIINVPLSATLSHQYVMNVSTKRWCRVTKWTAFTFTVLNGLLYAGFADKVASVWNGTTDFGGDIVGVALPAFSALGAPAMQKQVLFARLYYMGTGYEAMLMSVNVDFSLVPPTDSIASVAPASGAIWGTALWGSALWPSGPIASTASQSPGAIGYQISPTVQVASKEEWSWYATDVLFVRSNTVIG